MNALVAQLELPELDLEQLVRPPAEGPDEYRRRVFAYLGGEYAEVIRCVLSILADADPEFAEMERVHQIELRPSLLERHSLPYLLTHQALFGGRPLDCRTLAACLAGHTLALTHLDYHLDGSLPAPGSEATAVPVPPASAVSYAVRMIYKAGSIAAGTGTLDRLFADAFEPVSGFVISRMHADWVSRFDLRLLDADPHSAMRAYLQEPTSRLRGSGYWELMVRAAFITQSSAGLPHDLLRYSDALRRLRQVVDETADVDEDLRAGLITLPVIVAMLGDDGRIRETIRCAWRTRGPDGMLDRLPAHLCPAIRSAATISRLRAISADFADEAIAAARSVAGPASRALETLVLLKAAKLESVTARLISAASPAHFHDQVDFLGYGADNST